MEVDKINDDETKSEEEAVSSEPPDSPETPEPSPDFIPLSNPIKEEDDDTIPVPRPKNLSKVEKNGQKRIKTEPDDGVSKKPRITPEVPSPSSKEISDNIDITSDTDEYYLTVSNLPNDWTYVQIKNFLDKECCHIDEMEMLNNKDLEGHAIRLTFQSSEKCKDAFKILENKIVNEKKLKVEVTETFTTFPTGVTVPNTIFIDTIGESKSVETECAGMWKPDQDFWDIDPEGLYGLRPQFLKSLNIKPPINRLVHVTNFRCDRTELKEVMELAGNVLMCCVVTTIQKYAKVLYSHPLEAVQAISMLNGQMYYGNPLKIAMDKFPTCGIILPKGLANVGIGLGLHGRPIRNIAQQYQRYMENKSSSINPVVFSKINFSDDDNKTIVKVEEDPDEIENKINELIKSKQSLNKSFPPKIRNIDECSDGNSRDGSDRSTPETNLSKTSLGDSRKSSVGSLSPNPQTRNGSGKLNNGSIKTLVGTNVPMPKPTPMTPTVRAGTQSSNYIRPSLLRNPIRNPVPIPTPGHPNYGHGPVSFGNQPRPGPFGARPVNFMPVPRPPFGPQPMPSPFVPSGNMRPQMQATSFSGPRPFVSQAPPAAPRPTMQTMHPGNRVTVNFSNLPPSTTFQLLCEQLSQCGQVMSVQLTTPGCAVATFSHPSHAERCFQTFNRMNVEGYIIEVKYS